jgi:CheY-like chemotaxis protein
VGRLPHSTSAGAEPTRPATARSPHPLRVVLAEDNQDSRDLLQIALEQQGHSVVSCADGISAIEHAVSHRPDAMLIDLGLPGRDGFEVARAIRARLGPAVRLVALTGYGQPADRERALEAGFDEFLVKPADIAAVQNALLAS